MFSSIMDKDQSDNLQEQLSPEELAKQLREPEGEKGIAVGEEMNKGNYYINVNSFGLLDLREGESVLEVGFGNGKLIPEVLKRARSVIYCGVDYSETMVDEAKRNNTAKIQLGVIELIHGTIEELYYRNETFDKIVTVNTLYFWDNPAKALYELKRVLKPGGVLVIGFRDRDLVKNMPFTKFGFTLYSGEEAIKIVKDADFGSVKLETKVEPEIEFNGQKFELTGSFIVARK